MLPQPPGSGVGGSVALGLNSSGSIVVGASGPSPHMALWRDNQVFDLGSAPGFGGSQARAVNDAGTVVVGQMHGGAIGFHAGIWTPSRGMEPLAQYLAANGVVVPGNIDLLDATAVSADGRTFAGRAEAFGTIEGFIATIPGSGVLGLGGVSGILAAVRRRRTQVL